MLSRGVLRGFLTRLDPNARRAALAWERRKTQTKRPFSLGKKAWRIGAPDRIRTYGLRRRRPTLHPRLRVGARRQICRGARCSRRRAVSDVCGISLLRRSRSKAQQLWTSRAEGVFPLFRCGPLPSGSTGRSGGRAQPPFQLPPIPLGLDPGDSHPWDSAYHGPHDCHRPSRQSGCGRPANPRVRADGRHGTRGGATLHPGVGRAFLALWGTPWDGICRNLYKSTYTQSLTETVVLTLSELDRVP